MQDGRWVKIIGFVVVAMMLAGLANLLLDPGYGRADDESRRVRDPSGFSVVVPRGWTGGLSAVESETRGASITLAPEQVTGRSPSIAVRSLPLGHKPMPDGRDLRFQDQPARAVARQGKYMWTWRLAFERAGHAYEIVYTTREPQDMDRSALRPFIDSFRIEPRPAGAPAATTSTAATRPATVPVTSVPATSGPAD